MVAMTPDTHPNNRPEGRRSYVLAIDLGSGGHKIALVSDTGHVVASADEQVATLMLPGGGAEQDPDEWWQKTLSGSRKVLAAAKIPVEDIVAVACDSQWSLAVPVDQNGHHLMNAIHWLDTRGGPYNRKIVAGFPNIKGYGLLKLIKWVRLTGMVPTQSGIDSLGHVLFIKNERPDIYDKTFKFLEPMDYLTSRLTGKITATQKTMAPFAVVDNRRWGGKSYQDVLLGLAGLQTDKFPELIPNDGVVGSLKPEVAGELGLVPSTPVIAGIGDSNASLIGSGALADFETIIYIGTSMYMTCHVPFKKTDVIHTMTSLPSPFQERYYLLGEQGVGGRCVEHFLKNMVYASDAFGRLEAPADAFERFDHMASQAPAGSGGLIFLPWLNGSVVPDENPYARGGFINMSLNTDRCHMSRAIMESLAYNNRWTMAPAEKFIGRHIPHVRFSGGGALSNLWAQIHADVLGIPVYQIENPLTTTVKGTALLAFYSLGRFSLEDMANCVTIKQVFQPDEANKRIYDRMFAGYRSFYQRNKAVFRKMNRHKL
jgi:xylulokinase